MNNFDEVIDRRKSSTLKYDVMVNKFGREDIIPFWIADMEFKSPDFLLEALKKRIEHGIFGYNKIGDEFSMSVKKWMLKRHMWQIDQSWVGFSQSVLTAIVTIITEFTEVGDGVLIQPPVYYPFKGMIERHNRIPLENNLISNDGHYEMDFDQLEVLLKKKTCKMMILCSPHNPVGRVWTRSELERINELCYINNVLLVSDEIHGDIVFNRNTHIPTASIHDKYLNNVITCSAPSKTFNIAGLHVAYTIIPNEVYRNRVASAIGKMEIETINTFGLIALQEVYQKGDYWLEDLKGYLYENMKYVKLFLETNLPMIKTNINEATYLMWLDCKGLGLSQDELISFFVNEARIALGSGETFGVDGKGFMRMNIATPRVLLETAMQQLNDAVKKKE